MKTFLRKKASDDENWLPVADIMTSLFIIFLFIAIFAIQNVSKITASMPADAENSADPSIILINALREEIYRALNEEFKYDLPVWGAEIDRKTLAFRFNEPEVLFRVGSSAVRPLYKQILSDFFPRYLRVLEPFFENEQARLIDEIRIEGHTSSEWNKDTPPKEAFLKNMRLSQGRTLTVLNYCLGLFLPIQQEAWVQENLTAKGFSSTRLILFENGKENAKASRRVEFRVYLDIERMLKAVRKLRDDAT
jgi:outer membrane protein OmpA-like peptidoglycan-associated protein